MTDQSSIFIVPGLAHLTVKHRSTIGRNMCFGVEGHGLYISFLLAF